MCSTHYGRRRNGKKLTKRSRRDVNEIRITDDGHAEMDLYRKDLSVKCITLIDVEDVERANQFCWGNANGYVASAGPNREENRIAFREGRPQKKAFLHRWLIGHIPSGMQVDHINRDPLDNRKANLRIVTPQENRFNSEDIGGVTQQRNGLWSASIAQRFLTEPEAIAQKEAWLSVRIESNQPLC